jgi:hypothetical protein
MKEIFKPKALSFEFPKIPKITGLLLGFILSLCSFTLAAQSNYDFVGSANLSQGEQAIIILKSELRQVLNSGHFSSPDAGLPQTGNSTNGILENVFLTKTIGGIAEGKTTKQSINITGNALVDKGYPYQDVLSLVQQLLPKLD